MTALPQRGLSGIAPMTQLNTPYPSTAYLTGFLRSRGIAAAQVDLALALVLQLFSPAGLQAVRECIHPLPAEQRTTRPLTTYYPCDERSWGDSGGRRLIKKKIKNTQKK